MESTTLIFIPGHWNTPACYNALIESLLSYGYSSATVIFPYAGCDAATYDLIDAFNDIKATLTGLAWIQRDVILVLHPAHRRRDVEMKEKQHASRSLKTGVARMIFFMAYMDPKGFEVTNDESILDFAEFELERGTITVDGDDSMNVFFQYLPASEAQHWAARLLPQSVGAFWSTSNYTGWRRIPSNYMLHSDARFFRVPYAHYKLEWTRRLSGVR